MTESKLIYKMLKSVDLRPTVPSQSTSSLCSTCMAVDRKLLSLRKTPQFFNIFNGLSLAGTGMVCFECRARLASFVKFRSRAQQASAVLSCLSHSCRTPVAQIPGIHCLSTLTQTVVSPCDTIYLDHDALQVKLEVQDPEIEVKDEVVTVEPLTQLALASTDQEVKAERNYSSDDGDAVTGAKLVLKDGDDDDDGVRSGTASEDDGGRQRVHDPNITTHFEAKRMELAEVLALLERRRNAVRYKRAQYKCHKCAIFTSESQHRAHARLHDEERGRFKCEVCEQRYKDRKRLERHTATHYTRYSCRHCARSCFSYSQMYFHYRNVHDENTRRPCGKCPASFTNKRQLKRHMHLVHGRKYPCARCGRDYATSVGLQRHSLVHDDTVPELECDVCHKKYKGENNLKVHVKNTHQGGDAYCPECDMTFKTQSHYRRHLASGRHVPVEDYRFECDYCGRRCVQKMTLRTHIEQMHLKLAQYRCDVCRQSFHTPWVLMRHKRLKHAERPPRTLLSCYICEKNFRIRKSLDEHMNTHLGIRPFECKLCGATFTYSAALYNHNQLVHLKKKRVKKSSG